MTIKKLKVPCHYLLIRNLILRLVLESIISVTITSNAFKKKHHEFFFYDMGSSFIVDLILLGKGSLRKISSHHG